MNFETQFFTIDSKRIDFIRLIGEIINSEFLPNTPEEIPAKLQKINDMIEDVKLKIVEGVKISLKIARTDLEESIRRLVEIGFSSLERYNDFKKELDACEQAIQTSSFNEALLECVRRLHIELWSINESYCDDVSKNLFRTTYGDESLLMRMCSTVIKTAEPFETYYLRYFKLKSLRDAMERIRDYIFKEGLASEYSLLVDLARIKLNCFSHYAYADLQAVFNRTIIDNKEIAPILEHLRYLTGIDKADLVGAYSCLAVLSEKLSIPRDNIIKAFCNGLAQGLAYVLAQLTNRVNIEELAEELKTYALSILTTSRDYREGVNALYLNLLKILSMLLCADSIDWRTVLALGITASRYWRKWSDVSSINALCSGLRTLSQYVSKEDAEKIITYASIFGDYDIIIKLEPLVRARRSLSSIASLLS